MIPEVTSERPSLLPGVWDFWRFALGRRAILRAHTSGSPGAATRRPQPSRRYAATSKEVRNAATYSVREVISELESSAADRRQASTNAQREVPKLQCPG